MKIKMAISARYNLFIKIIFEIFIIIFWIFIILFQVVAVLLLISAAWCAYDGFYNEFYIVKHTFDGHPDKTLLFNRGSPPFFVAAAVILIILTLCLKWLDRKLLSKVYRRLKIEY